MPRRLTGSGRATRGACPSPIWRRWALRRLRGTTIHFRPDPQIFDDLNFNFTTLSQRLREVAFLNRSLRITLVDEREDVGEGDGRSAGADEDDDYRPADLDAHCGEARS